MTELGAPTNPAVASQFLDSLLSALVSLGVLHAARLLDAISAAVRTTPPAGEDHRYIVLSTHSTTVWTLLPTEAYGVLMLCTSLVFVSLVQLTSAFSSFVLHRLSSVTTSLYSMYHRSSLNNPAWVPSLSLANREHGVGAMIATEG